MINIDVQEKINQQLFDKLGLAYVCVDRSMLATEVSSNLSDYGFEGIELGVNVMDHLNFMVGLDSQVELDLPLVSSPSGIPVSVSLVPDGEQMTILISNASVLAEQRQQLQQAANENELLAKQQKALLARLDIAACELEAKNMQLEEASRLQTSFLSGVSHEFRTPLTSIIGYTNLVRQGLQKMGAGLVPYITRPSDNEAYLQAVQRSSKHLLSLVENLLDHGKLDSNEILIRPRKTDLAEVFDDVEVLLRPLCATKNISFDVNIDFTHDTRVIIDDSRLRQCLINLIGNAIKFTDEGSVSVHAFWESEMLTVAIQDTGPGISEADLEQIRLPFWQGEGTGKVGTGLGLTITEKIVNLMGSGLRITSGVGEGTHVLFDLSAPVAAEQSAPQTIDLSRNLRILLAEDDTDIADLVTMMLVEKGIQVTHVENGALALAALESNSYDMILMDIHMPVMTGYEAIEQLRKRNDNTPVVVMSASALDNDRKRADSLGCDGYLVKPVEMEDLLALANLVVFSKP